MRLFIAHGVNETVSAQLKNAIENMRRISETGRFVRPENLHITVRFIGETDPKRIPGIIRSMKHAVEGLKPCSLALSEPGTFPGRGEHIVWYGVKGETGHLGRLHSRLSLALENEGLVRATQRLKPHITLARRVRFKMPWARAKTEIAIAGIPFCVTDITLFKSERVDGVLTYIPMHTEQL